MPTEKKLFIWLNVPTLMFYFARPLQSGANAGAAFIQFFLMYAGALLAFFVLLKLFPKEKRAMVYNLGSLVVSIFLIFLVYLVLWGDAERIKDFRAPTGIGQEVGF